MPNQLIDTLPSNELAEIASVAEFVDLNVDDVLYEQGQAVDQVYFPESGMISLVTTLGNRADIETGTVGFEGMSGVEVFLGRELASNRSIVQIRGQARRLPTASFVRLADELPQFREAVRRYAGAILAVANRLAACNLVHPLKQRCARWLLTVHDHV